MKVLKFLGIQPTYIPNGFFMKIHKTFLGPSYRSMRSTVGEEKVSNFESPAKAKLIARKNWLQTQCRCRFLCQGKSSIPAFPRFFEVGF